MVQLLGSTIHEDAGLPSPFGRSTRIAAIGVLTKDSREPDAKAAIQLPTDLQLTSGEGGIRTRGTCDSTRHFQCRTFGLSVTSPNSTYLPSTFEAQEKTAGTVSTGTLVAYDV